MMTLFSLGSLFGKNVIATSGRVKLCTMEQIDNFEFGNVFKDNVKDIFDNNKDFLRAFALQQTPDFDAEECKGCEYQMRCASCILQNLLLMKEKNFECNWYKNKKMNAIITERVFGKLEV